MQGLKSIAWNDAFDVQSIDITAYTYVLFD